MEQTRTTKAIDYLLGYVLHDSPWKESDRGGLDVDYLLEILPSLSRGEQATVEAALTIYNGGEYLEGGNVLRHIMEWTDTVYSHRILKALMYVKHHVPALD